MFERTLKFSLIKFLQFILNSSLFFFFVFEIKMPFFNWISTRETERERAAERQRKTLHIHSAHSIRFNFDWTNGTKFSRNFENFCLCLPLTKCHLSECLNSSHLVAYIMKNFSIYKYFPILLSLTSIFKWNCHAQQDLSHRFNQEKFCNSNKLRRSVFFFHKIFHCVYYDENALFKHIHAYNINGLELCVHYN